jgi:hypothetical protein
MTYRSSRRSAKNLGRTTRIETPHDFMQSLHVKMFPTERSNRLDVERRLLPSKLLRSEEETMFYGS